MENSINCKRSCWYKAKYIHFCEIFKNIYPRADRFRFLVFAIPVPYRPEKSDLSWPRGRHFQNFCMSVFFHAFSELTYCTVLILWRLFMQHFGCKKFSVLGKVGCMCYLHLWYSLLWRTDELLLMGLFVYHFWVNAIFWWTILGPLDQIKPTLFTFAVLIDSTAVFI